MARYIKHPDCPKDVDIACISDTHLGSICTNEEALDRAIAWVRRNKKRRRWGFGGDLVEGKLVSSIHMDPTVLLPGLVTAEAQAKYAAKKFRSIAAQNLWYQIGNHDRYLMPDFDLAGFIMREMGLPIDTHKGGYQTWISLGPQQQLRIHSFHGRRNMPRGAKDPIQKEGNQNAWLANELFPLAADVHVQLMSHVHTLHVQNPISDYGLYTNFDGEDVKARHVTPVEEIGYDRKTGEEVRRVPKYARHYAVTGTFRRSGTFNGIDYSEISGFPPSPIGFQILEIRNYRCVNIRTEVDP